MIRIRSVTVLDKFRVRLGLTNGRQKTVDLERYLHGPIFEPIRNNPDSFRRVKVDNELGTIVWDNGADIDPDVLIEDLVPAWMDQRQERQVTSDNTRPPAVREPTAPYKRKKRR